MAIKTLSKICLTRSLTFSSFSFCALLANDMIQSFSPVKRHSFQKMESIDRVFYKMRLDGSFVLCTSM